MKLNEEENYLLNRLAKPKYSFKHLENVLNNIEVDTVFNEKVIGTCRVCKEEIGFMNGDLSRHIKSCKLGEIE